jgi:hypothetical protein
VVILEGGRCSYSKDDVYANKFNENTEDILFWEHLFKKFSTVKRIKFKSIGSKTTAFSIGLDIKDHNITTVVVAMDSEFDELLSTKIKHPNILYTKGYSWENDVWTDSKVLIKTLKDLTGVNIDEACIHNNLKKFFDELGIGIIADGYLFSKGSSFFPRKGHMQCINCQPTDLPEVKADKINHLLSAKKLDKSKLNSFAKRKKLNIPEMCYGHLLSDYCFQLSTHYIKKRIGSISNIPRDILNRAAINKYFEHFFNGSPSCSYYRSQFPNS